MEFWSRATGSTTWQRMGAWYKSGAPAVMSTTFTFGIMNIPLSNPNWSGEIRSNEKIELLDAYGRVLSGGTWGYYGEDEYQSDIFAYPAIYQSFFGVCAF
jgi:hypothetical protein